MSNNDDLKIRSHNHRLSNDLPFVFMRNHNKYINRNSKFYKKEKENRFSNIFKKYQKDFKLNNMILHANIKIQKKKNDQLLKLQKKPFKKWKKIKIILKFNFEMKKIILSKRLNGTDLRLRHHINLSKKQKSFQWVSGHYNDDYNKKIEKWYLIYPNSKFHPFWSWMNIFLFIYTAIFMPIKIAFISDSNTFYKNLDLFVNFLFFLDIFVCIITVISKNGQLIENIFTLFYYYATSWLLFDIISVFPFEYTSLFEGNVNYLAKLPKIIKLVKIIRLIKLSGQLKNNIKIKKIFLKNALNKQLLEFITFILIIILFTHITGCLWYFLIKLQTGENWLNTFFDENYIPTDNEIYWLSFYWAISTICTVGFGDVVPITLMEKIFNVIWIGVGVGFYSYIVGTLSTILRNMTKRKSIISSRFFFLNEINKEKNIDKKILEKFTIYLEYLEQNKKYISSKNSNNFLSDISLDLTYKLARNIHSDLINNVIFFQDKKMNFIAQITPYLTTRLYKKGSIIINRSEYPSFVYFLISGSVGFFNKIGLQFRTYIKGSYFGEIEIFKSCLRQFEVRAIEESKILILSREVFLRSMVNFPEVNEDYYKIAIKRDILNKKSERLMRKNEIYNYKKLMSRTSIIEMEKIHALRQSWTMI